MIHELKLENIAELDGGRVAAAWDQALQRAAADCDDRLNDDRERTVTLIMRLKPVVEQGGSVLDSLASCFDIKETVPARRTKTYSLGHRKRSGQSQLIFNDLSDDDINQRTIDEVD